MTTRLRCHRGFTLIELVIVLAMIGMLLTLAVPRYFHVLDRSKQSVQQQNIATVRDAIDKFFGDQARYPESLNELVERRYLRTIPIDPLTAAPNWIAIPPGDSGPGVYDVRSALEAGAENGRP